MIADALPGALACSEPQKRVVNPARWIRRQEPIADDRHAMRARVFRDRDSTKINSADRKHRPTARGGHSVAKPLYPLRFAESLF